MINSPLSELAFDDPGWMQASDVEYTRTYDPSSGYTYEIFDKDVVSLEFVTPDNWTWTPDCFEGKGDPLVNLSGIRTGFDAGWSFTLTRSNEGVVNVSNKAYKIEAEVLNQEVLNQKFLVTDYQAEIPGIDGTWNIDFNPSFNSQLEWEGVTGSASFNFAYSEEVTLWQCPIIGVPGATFDLGLGAEIGLDFNASITAELTSGKLGIKEGNFNPSIIAGLNGFGQASILFGLLGKGGVTLGGQLKQGVVGNYIKGEGWSWSAPGSLSVTGSAYVKIPLKKLWSHEFLDWELGNWDFLDSGTSPVPPTGSLSTSISLDASPNPVMQGENLQLTVEA